MFLLQPLHQWATGVQRNRKISERLEYFQERKIAILIGGFENVIEVADRLMIVQNQAEMDFWIVHFAWTRPLEFQNWIKPMTTLLDHRLWWLSCFSRFSGQL